MVVAVARGIKHAAHIHHDAACLQHRRVARADDFDVWKRLLNLQLLMFDHCIVAIFLKY